VAARAQQPAIPVIGYLGAQSADEECKNWTVPFLQGLKETGYVEGKNALPRVGTLRMRLSICSMPATACAISSACFRKFALQVASARVTSWGAPISSVRRLKLRLRYASVCGQKLAFPCPSVPRTSN
jgi:hypothetical protein